MMPMRDVIAVAAPAAGVEVSHAYGLRTLLVEQAGDFEAALRMARRASHGAAGNRRGATP
jgi:hypothetical protein